MSIRRPVRPPRVAPSLLVGIVLAATAARAGAQDARTVVEPTVPPACATLDAALVPVGDSTLAEADERKLDTRRVQQALDGCTAGRAVRLRPAGARRAFLTGPLQLRAGVALVVDSGAILLASRDPREYDVTPGSCGVIDTNGKGCRPLLLAERAKGVSLMGPGTVEGRGWAKMLGRDSSWWDLAQAARVGNRSQNNPRLVQLTRADDATLYRITLRSSPNFHVVYDRGTGFTAWGVVIHTPSTWARNTDGIDPVGATNVTITRSYINTGDDNVAIKAGNSPSANITVSHSHFYRGHGVSIGSETNAGVRGVRVFDLSIDGADNGLRIKSNASRGGLVQDVEYRDVCLRDTKRPIEMDTRYTASRETEGTLIPEYRDVRLKDVRVQGAGTVILQGWDAAHPLRIAFDNVVFDDTAKVKVRASDAEVRLGPGPMNLRLAGENVRVSGASADAPKNPCAGKFVANPMSTALVARQPAGEYAAIVDARAKSDADSSAGVPVFRSLGSALAALPANGGARTKILIRKGRYREKLTIDRPRLTIVGEQRDSTVLTYDAAAGMPAPGGGTWGTRGSYTLRVIAPDFRAERLTIENAFDYRANAARPDSDRTKIRDAQAVALMLDLGSDRAAFVDVRVLGHQDTLFPNSGRAWFHRCQIAGSVDFIFGAGQAVFEECEIVSRDRGSRTNNGYITAASTPLSQPHGFLFLRSRLTKEVPTMAANSVTLGRPWHAFGDPEAVASIAFVDCWMDDHIGERGWERMSMVDSTGNRVWWEPESARFAERGSTGPGAVPSPRRRVLSAEEAARWTPEAVLRGWRPSR